jgi:hypothetical protein
MALFKFEYEINTTWSYFISMTPLNELYKSPGVLIKIISPILTFFLTYSLSRNSFIVYLLIWSEFAWILDGTIYYDTAREKELSNI